MGKFGFQLPTQNTHKRWYYHVSRKKVKNILWYKIVTTRPILYHMEKNKKGVN